MFCVHPGFLSHPLGSCHTPWVPVTPPGFLSHPLGSCHTPGFLSHLLHNDECPHRRNVYIMLSRYVNLLHWGISTHDWDISTHDWGISTHDWDISTHDWDISTHDWGISTHAYADMPQTTDGGRLSVFPHTRSMAVSYVSIYV